MQAHADVLQRPILVADCGETVAFGAATLAKAAVLDNTSILNVAQSVHLPSHRVEPSANSSEYHNKRFAHFIRITELVKTLMCD